MSNWGRWLTGAISVLYLVVRLRHLGDSCLWFDEIFSVHAAEHDWTGMLHFVAQDLVHPPLFYTLLKLWIGVGGETVYWLRLLPVLFSVLALIPFLCLCKELKLPSLLTAFALLLIAVNGSLIKYTQTLRMYSLLVFFSLISIWLFTRYFYRGKSWTWLVVANVLLVYTQYFGWMVVGAEVLAILIFQRIKIARISAMAGIVLACFVPWLLAVWNAASHGSDIAQNIAWQPRPGAGETFNFFLDLVEPFYFQVSNTEPPAIYFISVPLLVICVAAVCVWAAKHNGDEEAGPVKLLSVLAAFPIIIAFVLSWIVPHSVWGTRHLIIVVPVVLLVVANALVRLPSHWFRWASMGFVLLLIGSSLIVYARGDRAKHVWCAWEDVAADIQAKEPSSTIYAFENLAAYHLWFATRRSEGVRIGVVAGVDAITADETYFLPRGFNDVAKVPIDRISDDEFWLAFRPIRRSDDARLIENFTRMGYTSCTRNAVKYDRNEIIWLKFAKDPKRCLIRPT